MLRRASAPLVWPASPDAWHLARFGPPPGRGYHGRIMDMSVTSIREPERDLPVRGEYDVVVLGGGPAGIAAAVGGRHARPQDAAGRALRLPRRHGHGRGRHQLLRAARQRAWRDPAGGARRRRRTAGAHRPARRPQRAACRVRQDRRRRPTTPRPTNAPPTICCSANGVDILFHALGAGVVMDDRTARSAP